MIRITPYIFKTMSILFRRIGFLLLVFFLLAPVQSQAQLEQARYHGLVNDDGHLLKREDARRWEQLLHQLELKTRIRVVIFTSRDSIHDPDEQLQFLYEKWQLNKRSGILLYVNKRELQARIIYNAALGLSDMSAFDTLEQKMVQALRDGMAPALVVNKGASDVCRLVAPGFIDTQQRASLPWYKKIFMFLFSIFIIYQLIRHPWLALFLLSSLQGGGGRGNGGFGGGFGGSGFGGFGGGQSGGGGASRDW
ncbi:MAG: TPM domain-containing protein [Spartobacteria bacterium]|nr:TPM domain-containing protein [Spartobacteria bacterium]